MLLLFALLAAWSPVGMSAEIVRRGIQGYPPPDALASEDLPRSIRGEVTRDEAQASADIEKPKDTVSAGIDSPLSSNPRSFLEETPQDPQLLGRKKEDSKTGNPPPGEEEQIVAIEKQAKPWAEIADPKFSAIDNKVRSPDRSVERAKRSKSHPGPLNSELHKEQGGDLEPQESNNNFQYQYDDDDDDDDYDDDDDSFDLFPRVGRFGSFSSGFRLPAPFNPRARLGEPEPNSYQSRGRLGESDSDSYFPRSRQGEAEPAPQPPPPPPPPPPAAPAPAQGDRRQGMHDDMFNGGAYNLPQAVGGSGPMDRFPSPDMGPFGGLPPLDPLLHKDVPLIDEPFPPRQLDIDNPIMVFREVAEADLYRAETLKPMDGSAAAEIKATCGTLPWTQYLSSKYGGFGAFLVILFLLYSIAVCCFVHAQHFDLIGNEGEQELL